MDNVWSYLTQRGRSLVAGNYGHRRTEVNYYDEDENEWETMEAAVKDVCGFRLRCYRLHVTQVAKDMIDEDYKPYFVRVSKRLEEQRKQLKEQKKQIEQQKKELQQQKKELQQQQLWLLSQKQVLKKLRKQLEQQQQQQQ
ncbi:hypothetical protein BV898_16880 [Hypsibius exemplaris]|uniref:Uncharacterized protein n=1 Tax=Hypsibius exemplaris TaxID=2072580 RepID=A0A9X6NG45_HYPEX|nr:hypothetical protein BV898_16880 [Hypsibius exemplaris]